MALVAILSARSTTETSHGGARGRRRAELSFAGQTLIEYQARQAHAVGAAHILILVDEVTPVLAGAVDRLAADGVHAMLIRDMPAMGRMIGAEDRILLIGDGHVLPADLIRLLAQSDAPRLFSVESAAATQQFERIDAGQMWAGALLAPARMLIGLIDMLGDWDLPLTLLRHVVQQGAARMLCEVADVLDGSIAIVNDQQKAEAATQALTRAYERSRAEPGDIDDWPVGYPARKLTPLAVRHEVGPAMIRNMGLGVGVLGFVAILGGLPLLGCLLCFAALVGERVAGHIDRMLRLVTEPKPMDMAAQGIAMLAILAIGLLHCDGGPLGCAGAIMFVGLIALGQLARRRGIGADVPRALIFAPGTALLLIGFGALIGAGQTLFAGCALLAFASHANQLLHAGEVED